MDHATFHFYAELNDFLPRRQRHKPVDHAFNWRASIKDMIESLGIPHAEIQWLVVNQQGVDFSYIVQPHDRIEVYPFSVQPETAPLVALRPQWQGKPRFVLDTHLGRLAAYLRMMGFDTLYRNDYPDDELAQVSNEETRILLTRDVGLLKRSLVIYGYFVRQTNPRLRLLEIIRRFNLLDSMIPFRRCMKCNGVLEPVAKDDISHELPHETGSYYEVFHRCQSCGQIYWKGAHYQRMQDFITQVTSAD